MKKLTSIITISLFGLLAIGLSSCADNEPSHEDILRKQVEDFIKSEINTPQGYKFVELTLIDSVLFSNNINYLRQNYSQNLDFDYSSMKRQESFQTEDPSMYDANEVNKLKASLNKYKQIITKIDSIEADMGDRKNDVASYTYLLSFLEKDDSGAEVMNKFIVQTGEAPDYKILNVTRDPRNLNPSPNEFPGYQEILDSIK